MPDSDSAFVIPVLSKETLFSDWRSDAKAYLRRNPGMWQTGRSARGILWGLLGPDVKPLVKQHDDDPKALWNALEFIFAPRRAGARFNAYRTLTSIRLREDETLLSLTGRVSAAMRLFKNSRATEFTLEKADEELQAVVLLMALPDEEHYSVLKAPFEQSSSDLKVSDIEVAYANHQAFRTAQKEGDTSQISPISGLAMAATSSPPLPSSSAPAAAPPAQSSLICAGCGKSGHLLLQCFKCLEIVGLPGPTGQRGAAPSKSP
ncbi:Integrase catalytic domain-containing protein [Mycena sanguinolenta]|uniref:Integrase catalytic domain-containing protein n=1 Tax=Mycena sanguinolenta TaxID=230812 RepID=A0A8H6ZE41_9AGAR|nr:Integrase catalytic domain-containing protein [Mycena sanguinolenta]